MQNEIKTMQYRVTHTTTYTYSESVPVCHNKLHLAPRDHGRQRCTDFCLRVVPEPPTIESSVDYFGNRVDYFSLTHAHRSLAVTAHSTLEVVAAADLTTSPPWEEVVQGLHIFPSADAIATRLLVSASNFVPLQAVFADYARLSFTHGRGIVEATRDLTGRIYEEFQYDPSATNVSTPVEEVFAQKSGVCQDFAHLEIACLRSLGLAARYVSGYLRTTPPAGQPRLVGADASHAWLSVYCGPLGWIDFDPTNNLLPTTDHITVAYGRDYGDVCPVKGVFVGGGDHSMSVAVDVEHVTSPIRENF